MSSADADPSQPSEPPDLIGWGDIPPPISSTQLCSEEDDSAMIDTPPNNDAEFADIAPPPPPVVVKTTIPIYPEGDLLVKLISSHPTNSHLKIEITTTVSSAILSLASPVFRRMLDSTSPLNAIKPKCEGQEKDLIELHDDNPTAMLAILHAMHMVPDQVPQSLTQDQLLEVAYAVDKYDCSSSMHFVASGWVRKLRKDFRLKVDTIRQSWVFIAETFGLGEATLLRMMENMKYKLENTARKREGAYWHLPHEHLEGEFIREDLLGAILQARQEEINKIFNALSVYKSFFGAECPSPEAVVEFYKVSGIGDSSKVSPLQYYYDRFYNHFDPCITKARNDLEKGLRGQGLLSWTSGRRAGKHPKYWHRSLLTLRRKVDNILLRHDNQQCTESVATSKNCPIRLLCEARNGLLLGDTTVPVALTWSPRCKVVKTDIGWQTFGGDDEEKELEQQQEEDKMGSVKLFHLLVPVV